MPKLGPTGEFPFGGPIQPKDRGGIYAGMAVNRRQRMIIMTFHTSLDWLATKPESAIAMAGRFRALVTENFGPLPYDASTLPFKVTANRANNLVEVRLPHEAPGIAANPEMFLGWADHLEKAALLLSPAGNSRPT